MQLHRMLLLLVTSLSAGSVLVAGCARQPALTPQVQQPEANVQSPSPVAQSPSPVAQSPSPVAQSPSPQREPDVVYVPTPEVVVDKMLELAKVGKDDVLYDLGSGDGRIPITAAQKFGTRSVGIELRPELIQEANQNAQSAGVSDRVQFLEQDLFQTDISKASVVTLYLLPQLNVKLRPKIFKELKPGTRIVSHDFDMGEWKPEQVVQVQGPSRVHTVYSWVVPETVPENLR
ncbi:MAG: methyltransferase domain-containing protein [Cyanobacteriota bacterium]